jgi:hypothetical protein
MWDAQREAAPPFYTDVVTLALMKQTNREKDYAVIGELARLMGDVNDRLMYSRSARDLIALAREHPERANALADKRSVLALAIGGRLEDVEMELDRERRRLMRLNERRLVAYQTAASAWKDKWSLLAARLQGLSLREAHAIVVEEATQCLPQIVEGGLYIHGT